MKKILLTALVVVAFATGALALTAARSHGPARMDRFLTHRVEDMLDDVHATDAQRQQVLGIKDKLVADGKALHAGQSDVKSQLLAQWQADKPDAARVHALVDGRADAMKSFAGEVADAILQVHDILTPEQRAVVTKKLERRLGE